MYEKIVDQNPYETPMMIYPSSMLYYGRAWARLYFNEGYSRVLLVQLEKQIFDHGANRLELLALMQGLADGYFILPYTIGDYLSNDIRTGPISTDTPEFESAEKEVKNSIEKFVNNKGTNRLIFSIKN